MEEYKGDRGYSIAAGHDIVMDSSGKAFSAPETYTKTISSLDEKRNTVMALIAGSAVVSTTITALPGDWGSSVANKIADLSTCFLIVLCAIMLEKFLLTIGGYVMFEWIVPIICILMIVMAVCKNQRWKRTCRGLIGKLLIVGVVIWFLTPVSVKLSDIIEETHSVSIEASMDELNETAEELQDGEKTAKESTGFLDGLISSVTDFADKMAAGVVGTLDKVQGYLGNLMEIFEVFLVTTCLIPVIVLAIMVLILKNMLNSIGVRTEYIGEKAAPKERFEITE